LKTYLGVTRANFLLLPVTLVALGAAAAAYDGAFDPVATVAALLGLVALHASVNAFNEYSDFRRGIDLETQRTPFSGGSGTLPEGHLSAKRAFGVAAGCAVFGLIIGFYFLYTVGWVLLPIFVLGALCVLGYTDFLARIYLGEFFAGLGLGTLPVLGTALIQGAELGTAAVAASVPPFFMTFNLLLLNEFPDEEADRKGGRRNLIGLVGRRGAAAVYVVMGWMVPLAIIVGVQTGALPKVALFAILPSLALIAPTRWAMTSPRDPVPVPALGANVIWNLATNTVLALALALTSRGTGL
jgi:1,4-dihydroxy-2-naphthoate octaprenyltransferase